ncbi:MAG: hypothetical protein HeimAB125_06540 [Candidatus Heimdallarchaeota archaeon AB_125]|nr:MAG: hypothetical protein HeimAB125_06540 [Candidatus Heimdallarchaeota archaeon AB_125]
MTKALEMTILDDGSESPISFKYLRKFNLAMGILHLVQGVAMLVLGFFWDFSRPLYSITLDYSGGPPVAALQPEFSFTAVGPTVAAFLLFSALAHLLIAGPLNKFYVKNLKKKMNPIRWFEYAFSSSIMVFFIAILFGVWDLWVLIGLFFLNMLMNLFGHMMELHNQTTKKTNWTAYIYGWIAGIIPWVIISVFFARIAINSTGMPWFVPVIYAFELILFMSFAFNMLLQYKKVGKWKDYLYGERMYQILSLVAKTLLAWLVFAGVFQPA